jgi:hypothetical protein
LQGNRDENYAVDHAAAVQDAQALLRAGKSFVNMIVIIMDTSLVQTTYHNFEVLSCKEHCLILNQPYEFRRNVYFV